MRAYFLFVVDERRYPISPITVNTPDGKVVPMFQSENEAMGVIARFMIDQAGPKHIINSVSVEFSSLKEIAKKFKRHYSNMNKVAYLPDSDPVVVQLVARLRQHGY